MIPNLAYELGVLAKAVQHKNLSAASVHIGLSQPQLSRLVARIEGELNVVLLDRSARRKSGWTPLAQELAISYVRGMNRLQTELLALAEEREVTELHIGTLEGLSPIAMSFVQQCFNELQMKQVGLDIHDFKGLDSEFLGGGLDLIFTVRPPSKQKYTHMIEVGHQQQESVSTNKDFFVYSPSELTAADKKIVDNAKHVFISNSLALRKEWLNEYGGSGSLPTAARTGRGKGAYSVYLIGSDLLSPRLWNKITDLFK